MCVCVSFSWGEACGVNREGFQDVSPQGEILNVFFLRAGTLMKSSRWWTGAVFLLRISGTQCVVCFFCCWRHWALNAGCLPPPFCSRCLSLSSQVGISRVPGRLRHQEFSAAASFISTDGQLHFTPLISHHKKNSVMTEQPVQLLFLCLQARWHSLMAHVRTG